MVVLIETGTGTVRKAFIRNATFSEVNEDNKKTASIPINQVANVLWPKDQKITKIPVKKWLEMAEENNFWGMN